MLVESASVFLENNKNTKKHQRNMYDTPTTLRRESLSLFKIQEHFIDVDMFRLEWRLALYLTNVEGMSVEF